MIVSLTAALWLGAVSARAQPTSATFGDRVAPRIELSVIGQDNAPVDDATVELHASVGGFGAVKALGGGRYAAPYLLPSRRFPQLAIVSIEVTHRGGREHAWLTLPLHARADLRIETEPGSRVTVEVGDHTFGPVRADRGGRASVAVVIPPCVASARIRARDPAGNVSEKPLDLQPSPFPHAFAFSPERRASWADGAPVAFEVFAVDQTCAPVKTPDGVTLRASAGVLGVPSFKAPGILLFPYRAPDSVGEGFAVMSVASGSDTTPIETRLELAPGPQTGFAIRFDPDRFVAGSQREVTVRAEPADAKGNRVPEGRPAERASADFGSLEGAPPAWTLRLPDRFEGRVSSKVRAAGPTGTSEASLPLETAPPHRVEWTARPRFLRAGEALEAELRVTDVFGNGVPAAPLGTTLDSIPEPKVDPLGEGRYRVVGLLPNDAPIGRRSLWAQTGSVGTSPASLDVGQYQRPWAFLLGASVTVQTNFVRALALVPRIEIGTRIARSNFDLIAEGELAFYRRFSSPLAGGTLTTSVGSYAVAVGARYSLPLSPRWSLFASAVAGVQVARSRLTLRVGDQTQTQDEARGTLLLRGALGSSVAIGRGRFFAQLEGSRAPARGQLSGNLGGMGVGVGYLHAF